MDAPELVVERGTSDDVGDRRGVGQRLFEQPDRVLVAAGQAGGPGSPDPELDGVDPETRTVALLPERDRAGEAHVGVAKAKTRSASYPATTEHAIARSRSPARSQ